MECWFMANDTLSNEPTMVNSTLALHQVKGFEPKLAVYMFIMVPSVLPSVVSHHKSTANPSRTGTSPPAQDDHCPSSPYSLPTQRRRWLAWLCAAFLLAGRRTDGCQPQEITTIEEAIVLINPFREYL